MFMICGDFKFLFVVRYRSICYGIIFSVVEWRNLRFLRLILSLSWLLVDKSTTPDDLHFATMSGQAVGAFHQAAKIR